MSFTFDTLPREHRCYKRRVTEYSSWQPGDCFFGVGKRLVDSGRTLKKIPANATGFHFYLGSQHVELFKAFCDSALPASTQSLYIGNTSSYHYPGTDYHEFTTLLLQTEWPMLERLELGVWHLFCNASTMYGCVGCLDGLATAAPALKHLELCGQAELTSPLSFQRLESLSFSTADTCVGAENSQTDPQTLLHLLSSSMPMLRNLYVDLDPDDEDGPIFDLPAGLLSEGNLPQLSKLEICGRFQPKAKEALLKSPMVGRKSVKLWLDEMHPVMAQ